MKIQINFPEPITQVDSHTVELSVKEFDGVLINIDQLSTACPYLTMADLDQVVDDATTYILTEGLKRSFRVRPSRSN